MRTAFALSVAALAAGVFAAPAEVVHVVVETQLQTVYVTEGYSAPTAAAVYEAPAAYTTIVYEQPTYTRTRRTRTHKTTATPTPVYTQPATSAAPVYTEAPTSAAAATSAAPAATGTGYMAVVDTWRSKMGLSVLAQDSKLESNAMDCVVSSAGSMVHKLNPGSYGQVLAPGNADDFEHVFVGGWLCEMPNLAGLDGVCATQSEGWSYQGQTGHAEILTSASYSKIGCALYDGIWACDLA